MVEVHSSRSTAEKIHRADRRTVQALVRSVFGNGYKVKNLAADAPTNVLYEVEHRTDGHHSELLLLRIEPSPKADEYMHSEEPRSEHIVDQAVRDVSTKVLGDIRLTLRKRLDHVLSDLDDDDLSEILGVEKDSADALDARWKILNSVLLGLRDLRRTQTTFDVRLSNIGYDRRTSRWMILDWGRPLVKPYETSSYQSPRNTYGALIQRTLGSYIWDNRDLPHFDGLATDAFEWVLDYYAANSNDVPVAEEVIDAVLGAREPSNKSTVQKALDEIQRLATHAGNRWTATYRIADISAHLQSRVNRFPETSLAVDSIAKIRHMVDVLNVVVRNTGWYSNECMPEIFHDVEPITPPLEGIDEEWKDRLHRYHFGYALDIHHEARMHEADLSGLKLPGRDSYTKHVEAAGSFRRSVLERVPMIYTEQVVDIMSRGIPDITRDDVVAMRRWGDILAVKDYGRWLHPIFQFSPNGVPFDSIGIVSERIGGPDDRWAELSWWAVARRSLGGRALSQVIGTEAGMQAIERALETSKAA